MSQNIEKSTGSVYRQWIFSLVSSTMVFTYGLQIGWMSPSIPVLKSENSPSGYPLTSLEISWIASTLCITACISCTTYSYIADRFGRHIGLIAVAVPQALGFITTLISAHPIALLISRALCGIGSGGVFVIGPVYIKEISEDNLRGILGTVNMLVQSIALLIMYAIGAYLDYYTVIWIVVWVPILNIVAMIKAPESPGYLVKKGRIEEAISVMAYLRDVDEDDKKLQIDLQRMKNEVAQFDNLPATSLKTIISDKTSRRAILLAFFLLSSLDMSGNFAIFTYASVIIRDSGVTLQPELQSLSFPTVMILGSLTSVVAIERLGRKPLFLASLLMTGIPMAILASILMYQNNGGEVHWSLPILCIISCVYSNGVALPLPYVVMSEIFNVQLRALILGYIVTYGWFLCFLQTIAFAPISDYLGMHTTFYVFSGINLICAVIMYILVPETKGKSLEEIEKKLRGDKE